MSSIVRFVSFGDRGRGKLDSGFGDLGRGKLGRSNCEEFRFGDRDNEAFKGEFV